MFISLQLAVVLALQLGNVFSYAIREFDSLAGLSNDEIEKFARSVKVVGAQPPPAPISDTSAKLVHDIFHPFIPLFPGQQRGPCPGLNTLASHGYLPRSGVATPAQIITAVQEAPNAHRGTQVTYAAFLVDGNPLTNLMSIGIKSPLTGPAPPSPALVSGLSTHATFEGDSSMTRGDAFFGDNHSFNETLFQQIVDAANLVGGGKYTVNVAAEVRFRRVQDSIATNPQFDFGNPRFATAFAETVFPLAFFIDGRSTAQELDLDVMRSFFQDSRMPVGFHRRDGPLDLSTLGQQIQVVMSAHQFFPGFNNGTVNNFVPDVGFLGTQTNQLCALVEHFTNNTLAQYPNPKGALRTALNQNLDNFFSAGVGATCVRPNIFP
ncbi:Cloroperoxidase [Exidia glandulosa HHB12029]|uniref:Cloroperoxidase n=1 Tax=Exidia glandulosa HHB12029 TaxID=1314781 RepID=A0A165IY63_EXIGL|nr:Cloroperoxidase [Exidia glandulosa HHB12029]